MNAIFHEAQALEDKLIAHRRYLHAHAEVDFDLTQTQSYVKKTLQSLGLKPKDCGLCGVVCTVGQGDRTFLLRADMDALPIKEETALDFSAKNGCMHACGHDMHTAMLLGAAEILKNHENELGGCVKLMFQPAEETLRGAQDMIDSGVLENPAPEAGMMLHVMTGVPMPVGTLIVSPPGVSAPAVNMFEIRIQGRGGHGASPNLCIDPVNAAAHVILALQTLQAREMSTMSGALLTIGAVLAGDAPNVIADHAILRGSLRAYTDEECDYLRKRLTEISELTAKTFRAEATVTFTSGAPTLINDKDMCSCARRVLPQVLGEKQVIDAAQMAGDSRSSGSEDFACISHRIPVVMAALAAGDSREGYAKALHHPHTRFDEAALKYGAAAYAGMAMGYFEECRA